MESIQELKNICQSGKRNKKKSKGMIGYLFYRDVSIYFTRALLILTNKKANPNIITFLNIFGVFVSGFLLMNYNFYINLLGFILLFFIFIFDKVDGEIARYLKKETFKGAYLEKVYHFFLIPTVFFAAGLKIYNKTHAVNFLLLCFIGVILIIFNTVNSNFLYSILFRKKLNKTKEIYRNLPQNTSNSKVLKILKYLKFSTLVSRADLVIILFFIFYIFSFLYNFILFQFFYLLFVFLLCIRFFRIFLQTYFTMKNSTKKIVDDVFNYINNEK